VYNNETEIESRVTKEDFPREYRRIVDQVGIRTALDIIKGSGGIMQYIPAYHAVTKNARDRLIKEEFTGDNYKDLAIKYGMSEVWIRDIIAAERRKKEQIFWKEKQISLFG
jgi:Mor family transcriptional regulator